MYEENQRFSWASLFIKIIIIIIFVLFTIWLLSLSTKNATKGLSSSLNVLTDNIFKENVDRMKDVGTSYFTTERLPEKVGEVKTLTLASMYDKNLILEVKDKNGKACSAKNSYVSVEKLDTEYQMKVYLECGDESNFIKVIMGCYNYCNTDICEKKDTTPVSGIEYQYSKTTGGKWSPWGNWSEWSKTTVSKTNYRDVETKTVEEEYDYEDVIIDTTYVGEASCPTVDSYTLVEVRNGLCTYTKTITDTTNPTCPSVSGYSLTGRNGSTCSYSKSTTTTANPICSELSGYTNTGRSGFTCNYSKSTTTTANPTCPSLSGYTNTGRSGFTCNYSKTTTSTANPVCPSVSNFSLSSRSGFTCNYSRSYREVVGKQLVSSCDGCAAQWQTIYETKYEYATRTASCPDGYTKSGTSCTKSTTTTATKVATCPSGYTQSGTSCTQSGTTTTTKAATCPSGYTQSGTTCAKSGTSTTTREASCSNGYTLRNGICAKDSTSKIVKDATCASGLRVDSGKCYEDKKATIPAHGTKKVTYYRYRVREYTGGITDYKWSTSNNDKSLLNAGYKLTGKTRNIGGK